MIGRKGRKVVYNLGIIIILRHMIYVSLPLAREAAIGLNASALSAV